CDGGVCADGGHGVTLRPGHGSPVFTGATLFTVRSGSNNVLQGLELVPSTTGISINAGADSNQITGNYFVGGANAKLGQLASNGNTVSANRFDNPSTSFAMSAIQVSGGSGNSLLRNIVRGPFVEALDLGDVVSALIDHNSISLTSGSFDRYGLNLHNSSG